MLNVRTEIEDALKDNGKRVSDIKWIGTLKGGGFNPIQFLKLAEKDYTPWEGGWPQVSTDLLVVGVDWWLERRAEPPGEWWEFKAYPKQPPKSGNIGTVAQLLRGRK